MVRPRLQSAIPLLFSVVAAFSATGCAEQEGSGVPDPGVAQPDPGDGEDELREQSLKLVGVDALTVKDSPVLKAGAEGALACSGDHFVRDGRERITCTRGDERLEVILHKAEKKAVVAHRQSRSGAATFFVCTSSGNGPGDLPGSLGCSKKAATSASGHGGLASPFAPTAPGIRINNAHLVGGSGQLLRAMAPHTTEEYGDLAAAGVGAVLVFKNQTGHDDLGEEIAELASRGVPASRVSSIPFKWKDIGPFAEPCKQTIEALKFIASNVDAGRKTFFHCTVGEDRTGMLAAVHRLINEPGLAADAAFDQEMCERGYGSGNPLKPAFVTGALEQGLTPLYRKLAFLVATGKIKKTLLDPAVCAADPESDAGFSANALPLARLQCGTSTRFEP